MSHLFGDRLSQHLHRKHGLSQSKLAAGILQAPAIITDMCKGRRLTSPQARERVLAIIQWLHQQAALATVEEANALLIAAGMLSLQSQVAAEAMLLQQLQRSPAQPPAAPAAHPVDHTSLTPRHNLPVQSTTFIGRETEQTQLAVLLADPHCRLLTLVGPGGVGKTRLALQAVTPQLDRHAQGIWFVALAPLLTADLVAATCLEALNLGQQPHLTPDEQLLHYLRHKDLLLILDNFEHLPEAVVLVKGILSTAPQVKLLVTSRERLKVQDEWVFTVNGLETTTVAMPLDAAQGVAVADNSASRLFVERARRLQPTFTLTDDNAVAIAQLCCMVDGIPLAIELAAGWSRLLPPAAIAQAIAQDIGFLSSAWQDLPARHQSLTAVFAHSWQLLPPAEQTVLCQLVVFRGGFDAAAAQAVAGAALTLLAELVDKSWLRVNNRGRFDLHELIRQFIVYQNGAPTAAVLARHGHYYGAFLQSQEPFLYGPRQREVLTALLAEVENIRQGWRWVVAQVEIESIGQYLRCWQWLGSMRSWHGEMVQLFREAVDRIKVCLLPNLHSYGNTAAVNRINLILARLLLAQADHVCGLGDAKQVEALCEESLVYWPASTVDEQYETDRLCIIYFRASALYAQGHSAEAESLCLKIEQECLKRNYQIGLQVIYNLLGMITYTQGQVDKAQQWFERNLAIASQLGTELQKLQPLSMLSEIFCNQGNYALAEECLSERHRIVNKFGNIYWVDYIELGYLAFLTGKLAEAEHYFQQNLQISDEINDDFTRFVSWRWFGQIAYRQQDYAKAQQCFNKALTIARAIHRQNEIAIALTGLGNVACAQRDLVNGRTYFHQALTLLQKTGALPDLLSALVGMSQLRLQEGALEPAAQLLDFVRNHPSLLPLSQQAAAQVYAQLQTMVPEEKLITVQTVGTAMTIEEAIVLALTRS